MSSAAVINATATTGRTAGSPITIQTDGTVTLRAYGVGSGAWSATLAFAPVVGGVVGAPITLTISNVSPTSNSSSTLSDATQWVGWITGSTGEFEASGIVEGITGADALGGFLGDFEANAAPTKAVRGNATATIAGVPSVYTPGVGWVAQLKTTLQGPIKIGYFGPSTADNGLGVCDMGATYATYPGSGYTIYWPISTGKNEASALPGNMIVSCGGVSGETINQSNSRFLATYSASRKSAFDVVQLKPNAIIYRSCAINDIQTYSSTASDAEINAKVSTELKIVEYFAKAGIPVCFSGPLGYSAAVSQALLDVRRDALIRYLSAYKSRISAIPGAYYIDVIGITCDAGGAMLSSAISSDGVHLTGIGGGLLANAEDSIIKLSFATQSLFGSSTYDGPKEVGLAAGAVTVASSGGNSHSGTTHSAFGTVADITAVVGGDVRFSMQGSALNASVVAGKNYVVVFDTELLDASGAKVSNNQSIVFSSRVTLRNAGGKDVIFDTSSIMYRQGKLITHISSPSAEAPASVTAFVQVNFGVAGQFRFAVKPLGIYRYDSVP